MRARSDRGKVGFSVVTVEDIGDAMFAADTKCCWRNRGRKSLRMEWVNAIEMGETLRQKVMDCDCLHSSSVQRQGCAE